MDYGRVLENIAAIELMRRGYEVYAGVLYKKEIDFVAIRRSEKLYIQVSDNISDEKTFQREVGSLLQIKDAYPKILLARTRHDAYQYEGVQIIDLAKWLITDSTKPEQTPFLAAAQKKDLLQRIREMSKDEIEEGLRQGELSVADIHNALNSWSSLYDVVEPKEALKNCDQNCDGYKKRAPNWDQQDTAR